MIDILPPAFSRPALFLAPHLEYPAFNGADVTIVDLARALSKRLPWVDVVAAHETVTYNGGKETARRAFSNAMRSKPAAAMRTIGWRSHYYLEKFVTPAFAREARAHLARPGYGLVYHSYLTTSILADLPDADRTHVVWSHNDEFQWFEDLRESTRNPIGKAAASASLAWLSRYLGTHRDALTLLHVTQADLDGWERHVPGHRGAVVPIGVALRGDAAPPLASNQPVRLVFSGALGVRMNYDALAHFADRYALALQDRLGHFTLTVVGSTPLDETRALCRTQGWTLRENVSDDEMDRHFREATFSLLPFPYATGAKLKLLKSLAYGVPVLATSSVGAQADLVVPPSLMSDDPTAWADHAAAIQASGLSAEDRGQLRALAEAHSWDASAERLLSVAAAHA